MKRIFYLVVSAAFLQGLPVGAYDWYPVPIGEVEHAVYEIQFDLGPYWGGHYFTGVDQGVFRGDGAQGNWEGMGLEYPAIGGRSVLCLPGSGWSKQVINDVMLQGATGTGIGDLDGDGFGDVVVAAKEASHAVVSYENPRPMGTQFWAADSVQWPALGAREVSLADIDGDNDLDIAAALRDEDQIVWYESREHPSHPGEIEWIRHDVGGPLGGPRGVFVADINADDHLDIVAGGMNDNTVVWYEAPMDPTQPGAVWTTHVVDPDLLTVKGVFVCDIDLDEDLDIVAAGREAGHVVWYEQTQVYPGPWVKHFIDEDLPGAVSVWAGDLNGDGWIDVAATAKYANSVVVYEGPDQVGDVWIPNVIDPNLGEACAISAGDFDGDGRTDIIATGRGAQVVAWYRNPFSEGMPWEKYVIDIEAGSPMGVTTGDVDNDGDLDVVATAVTEGLVHLYLNDLSAQHCAFSEGSGSCEADGIYKWHDLLQEWEPLSWCPRPFFLEEHPLIWGNYLCGNHDGLFASPDMVNWVEVGAADLPDTIRCIWFHPMQDNIMMVGSNRGMYRTEDFGLNWFRVGETPHLPVHEIEQGYPFYEPPVEWVFAVMGNGSFSDCLCRSLDGGVTWELIFWFPYPTCLTPELSLFGPSHVLYIGTAEDGVHRVAYDGTYLGDFNEGLGCRSVNRLRHDPFIIGGDLLYACTERGLYARNPHDQSGTSRGELLANSICAAYPNPWRESVYFSVTGRVDRQPVRARVFDSIGREVWSAAGAGPGTTTLHWNGRGAQGRAVAAGVYFYRIETAERVFDGNVLRVR